MKNHWLMSRKDEWKKNLGYRRLDELLLFTPAFSNVQVCPFSYITNPFHIDVLCNEMGTAFHHRDGKPIFVHP